MTTRVAQESENDFDVVEMRWKEDEDKTPNLFMENINK